MNIGNCQRARSSPKETNGLEAITRRIPLSPSSLESSAKLPTRCSHPNVACSVMRCKSNPFVCLCFSFPMRLQRPAHCVRVRMKWKIRIACALARWNRVTMVAWEVWMGCAQLPLRSWDCCFGVCALYRATLRNFPFGWMLFCSAQRTTQYVLCGVWTLDSQRAAYTG